MTQQQSEQSNLFCRLRRGAGHLCLVAISCLIVVTTLSAFVPEPRLGRLLPSDLPEAAKTGFEKVRDEAQREGVIVGGIRILHSSLLERSFPDFCFVRVDFTGRRSGSAYIQPVSVYMIPLKGGPVHRVRCEYSDAEQNVVQFLKDAKFQVMSKIDAETLRRILWEIWPSSIGVVGVEARGSEGREWRLGDQQYGYNVTVDAVGIVQNIQWGSP